MRGRHISVIEIRGLTKTFNKRGREPHRAVDGLDLVVEEGGVFGLLGPNGSGKTTTLRLLLGLVHADAGEMRLLNRPVPRELPTVLPRIGALVETPIFFPTFTGRLNLRLLAGIADLAESRIDEVLDRVDLRGRADDPVRQYSLGMRQRLGIAAALLKRPTLLILDEPTNGLDPAGMKEMREFVRAIAQTGETTVVVSSHLLGELQQICDRVGIIQRGKLIASGTVSEILASRPRQADVRLRVADLAGGERTLRAHGFEVQAMGDELLVSGVDDPARVAYVLAQSDHYTSELVVVGSDLESAFLELTKDAS